MHKRAIADDEPEMEATIDDKVEFLRVQYVSRLSLNSKKQQKETTLFLLILEIAKYT